MHEPAEHTYYRGCINMDVSRVTEIMCKSVIREFISPWSDCHKDWDPMVNINFIIIDNIVSHVTLLIYVVPAILHRWPLLHRHPRPTTTLRCEVLRLTSTQVL